MAKTFFLRRALWPLMDFRKSFDTLFGENYSFSIVSVYSPLASDVHNFLYGYFGIYGYA